MKCVRATGSRVIDVSASCKQELGTVHETSRSSLPDPQVAARPSSSPTGGAEITNISIVHVPFLEPKVDICFTPLR